MFKQARILVVDDEPSNVLVLRRLLEREGFERIESTSDSREVVKLYVDTRPDLILLDLHMPYVDGLEVLDRLSEIAESTFLPVLVMTGDLAPEARQQALLRGAKDFVTKPFHADEVVLRIRTLLETRFLYFQVQSQNQILEAKVRERTRDLEAAQNEIIERLARAAEFRDDKTGQHTERVGQMAALLARHLGLSDWQVLLIRRAAPLHDVGKIGIPDAILLKLGKLTIEEFQQVKTHTTIGARILSGSRFSVLRVAEEIAFSHHERWDGNGYLGLAGDQIPLPGRIVAVADVFDALTQRRPYKEPWPVADAVEEIRRQRGLQFDPAVVDAFLRVIAEAPPPEGQPTAAQPAAGTPDAPAGMAPQDGTFSE
jgi:putative two-component system response regulator